MSRVVCAIIVALGLLGGCGKKGPLQPPPGYGQQQPADAD